MTKKIFWSCTAVFCLFLLAPFVSEGAESEHYMVTADIVGVTTAPGQTYEREGSMIHYSDELETALIYGNIIKAVPLAEGEYAGRWARTLDDLYERQGYVDMAALAPMPDVEFFPAPDPCRFVVDSPELFLLPGSFPILDYTLPLDEPYYVLAGEGTDGLGTSMDAAGQDWTLLRFDSRSYYERPRHAWTMSENVMRLSQYRPDHTKVDSALVPRYVRDFGAVEEKFRESLLRNGFALDAAPIIHEQLLVDDLVECYPDTLYAFNFTPNFVTTDLFLHVYHLVFSRSLKKIEEVDFVPTIGNMLEEAIAKLNELEKKSGENTKAAFDLVRDFLTIPAMLAKPAPEFIATLRPSPRAQKEFKLIMDAEGMALSDISGKIEDYTFYEPRGHYTTSETLSNYFRAMAYLGGMSLPLNTEDPERNRDNTALTALLCVLFEDESLRWQWSSLYDPLTCLIGEADDPTIRDYAQIAGKFLNGSLDKLND
ncbi:MAG: DUF3160 domain-containing protein, partial [Synergistaceae bacterium]|nr:DUF3160 domain-containing protein [Synergistaceae bacterium]